MSTVGAGGRGQPPRLRGRGVAWLPPLLLLVAITVVDFVTGVHFRMISWAVLVLVLVTALGRDDGDRFATAVPLSFPAVDTGWWWRRWSSATNPRWR